MTQPMNTASETATPRVIRKRDAASTRARILKVATREFAAKGYEGARTDDIADRADINKRMIYHYFDSKEHLYLAVLEGAYERARTAEQNLDLDDLSPREGLLRLAAFTFDSFVKDRTFISLLNTENRQKARILKRSRKVGLLNTPLIDAVDGMLRAGEASGVLRPGLDALQLWISIVGLSYFYFSNIHTLSVISGRDLGTAEMIAERRAHLLDFVTAATAPR